ncbi:hypothetical protein [Gaetbulibacter saemankumensis]|uniref:hypothetical protein n=1 Tax=Gaetbulibacter saemankumensis TaxID=311208 RepID=UPI00042186BD|nr:hypothetical protein [Gaetbulibacter saemankumensis]
MKYLLLLVFVLKFSLLSAQISFKTGSVQLDADLNTINRDARTDINLFMRDLSLSYNVSEGKLNYMYANLKMIPGDMYLSLEFSREARVSLDRVINVYKTHKSKGWGFIAKELGIKPGSPAFHRLKNNASNKKTNSKGQGKKLKKGKNWRA